MPTRKHANRTAAPPTGLSDPAVFVTSRGIAVTLAPFQALAASALRTRLLAEWKEDGKLTPDDKPTYQLTTAAGVEETHEHDEQTIRGDAAATAAWTAWQTAAAAFEREVNEISLRTFIIDGMRFEIQPNWLAKAKAKHLRVPADEYEAKIFWVETEVFGTQDDYLNALTQAAKLAGVTEQQLTAVRATFRREVGVGAGQGA